MLRCLVLLILVTGCQNFAGPREAMRKPRADQPGLSIEEQQRRARDKYAIPSDDFRIGPAVGVDAASPTGR